MKEYDIDNIVKAIQMESGLDTATVIDEGPTKKVILWGNNIGKISSYLLEALLDLSNSFSAKESHGATKMVFTI